MPENISLVGFLSRATPAGPVSIPSRCPLAHPYTSLLVTVNTQYLSGQRLRFLALEDGAKLIIETIRRYCRRLVILGLWFSNPSQIPLYRSSTMHTHKNTPHKKHYSHQKMDVVMLQISSFLFIYGIVFPCLG